MAAINTFPASIQNVVVQQNYLDRKYKKSLLPSYVFRNAVKVDWFEGNIGETKTFTRSNLIAPNITPLAPGSNTGLDNGITIDNRGFEQWLSTLGEYPGGLNLNLVGNEDLIADLFIDNLEKIAQKAGNSLELLCTQRLMQAYDSGDTFFNTASGPALTAKVDNIKGFDTQFTLSTLTPSYGLPQPVSPTNTIPVLIYSNAGAFKQAATVTGVTPDGSNVSYMQSGALINGVSGTLTFAANVTVVVGDRIVAMDPTASVTAYNPTFKDGSYVVRPSVAGVMRQSAYQMAITDIPVPTVQIAQMVALLKRRGIPKLANGLYGCAIDPTIMAYFFQDQGFQIATQGTWDRSPVFQGGIIAKGWGVEFVEATQLPVYLSPVAGAFNLRHAVVFGADAVTEHPFAGAMPARQRASGIGDGGGVTVNWVDRIQFINQGPLDRLNEQLKMSYKFIGDFQPGTDKGSNPNIVLSSDWCRFKRAVIGQFASPI